MTTKAQPSGGTRSLEGVLSNVSYEFLSSLDSRGCHVPVQLGRGKFAKVYKGWQRSSGRNVRPVAIKVLHDYASYFSERLFKGEIDMLKALTAASGVNVVTTLDIVHLQPMAMCGCGAIYHPYCPRGCDLPLQRKDSPGKEHASLHCSKCGYDLPGEFINERYGELITYPAKACCQVGPRAQLGTVLNFVDREAVVMELLEQDLSVFLQDRLRSLDVLRQAYGALAPPPSPPLRPGALARAGRWLWEQWVQDREDVLLDKVTLLEKVLLMVQLAEAVAWLHTEMRIVHKDLAPDNVMIKALDDRSGWRGHPSSLRELLRERASHPQFSAEVIDFGLADREELSRSWYEEDVGTGGLKSPFLSPEAMLRTLPINSGLDIDAQNSRFPVPAELRKRLMVSDIIADRGDREHLHDLHITRLETEPATGQVYAYFSGKPPAYLQNRQFEQVRRLGEPHDIYALGALFYYILTGQLEEVTKLKALVEVLQDPSRSLRQEELRQDTVYGSRRQAIPHHCWQDELLVLVLRAMVREKEQSFIRGRTDRGPEAAQQLLRETKRIYHSIQEEIFSAALVSRVQRAALMLVMLVVLAAGVAGLLGQIAAGR